MSATQMGVLLRQLRRITPTAPEGPVPNAELLERFTAQGDESAFAALVERHGPMVLGVCRGVLHNWHDAEDAFQATFLVLARKAATIRRPEALGGWLFEVAYHVAVKAQARAARRRACEERAPEMTPADPLLDMTLRDLRRVIYEELSRLPEKYRAPLVLCYLESKTHDEAAQQLGWSRGTLRGRLDRGRKLVRGRLTRRGLTLGAGMFTLGLSRQPAHAVPPTLADAAVKVAGLATRNTTRGCPAAIAALAEGVTTTMFVTTRIVTTLLLTLGLLVAGALTHHVLAGQDEQRKADPPRPAVAPTKAPVKAESKNEAKGNAVFRGRVLDPDGKPFAGARLYVLYYTPKKLPAVPSRGTSDKDGRFQFSVAKAEFERSYSAEPWSQAVVVAVADGYGLGMPRPGRDGEMTLQLAREGVIRGRIVDLQGRPIRGVTVRVQGLYWPKKGDLAPFLAALKSERDGYPTLNAHLIGLADWLGRDFDHLYPTVTTGADGRFQLKGIGHERLAILRVEGPTIEAKTIHALTRRAEMIQVPEYRGNREGGTLTYHGSPFDHASAPTKPVIGVVRDKDAGKPIAGAVVQSYKLAGNNISGRTELGTTADGEGRFRLVGLSKGEGNEVLAAPPDGQPYLMSRKSVPDTPGLDAVTVNIELKRGVWVKGRVVDKEGKPVRAIIEYCVFEDNPHRNEVPGWVINDRLESRADDGSFQLVGLPGRGLVAVRAWDDRYIRAVGAERFKPDASGHLRTYPHLIFVGNFHTLYELNPAKDARSVKCEVVLDQGRTLTGTVLGPDGKPLAGARAGGLMSHGGWEHEALKGTEFKVLGLHPGQSRRLLFIHAGKRLAGTLLLKGDEKGPVRVKLGPWGTLTGRLVNPDGQPRSDVEFISLLNPQANEVEFGSLPDRGIRPDKDGRFRLEGLVPGLTYSIGLLEEGYRLAGYLGPQLKVKPGETKDLGNVRVKPTE